MNEDRARDILEELRRQGRFNRRAVFGSLVILAMAVAASLFLAPHLAQRARQDRPAKIPKAFSWQDVGTSFDQGNYEEALRIAKELTDRTPNYWYGYSYMGLIHQANGDLEKAEDYLEKAFALFPTNDNKEALEAVRTVLRTKSTSE